MQQWRTSCSLQTGQLKHDACFTLPTPRSPSPMMAALKVRVARVYERRRRYSEMMDRTLVGPSWDAALQPYVGQKVGGIPTSRNAARAEFADSCDLHRSATRAESPFAPRPKRGLFLSLFVSSLFLPFAVYLSLSSNQSNLCKKVVVPERSACRVRRRLSTEAASPTASAVQRCPESLRC